MPNLLLKWGVEPAEVRSTVKPVYHLRCLSPLYGCSALGASALVLWAHLYREAMDACRHHAKQASANLGQSRCH